MDNTQRQITIAQQQGIVNVGCSIENQTANFVSTPQVTSAKYRHLVQNPYFITREGLSMAHILETLKANKKLLLCGDAGQGKTQIALEYSYGCESEYDFIFWIESDTVGQIQASLSKMSTRLELSKSETFEDLLNSIWDWCDKHEKWLLIFNNADNPDIINQFLTHGHSGHILATSRVRNLKGFKEGKEITTYTQMEAISFIKNRLKNRTMSDEQVSNLVKRLAFHPLALEQAASYLQENTLTSIETYLTKLDAKKQEMLTHLASEGFSGSLPPENDIRQAVWTTWSISIDAVASKCLFASKILDLCAFLSPDSIGLNILQEFVRQENGTIDILEDAIQKLNNYSLIKLIDSNQALMIHRLLQEVIREKLDDKVKGITKVLDVLNNLLPVELKNLSTWPILEELVPHSIHLSSESELSCSTSALILLKETGKYLHEKGLYEQSKLLFEKVLMICKELPEPNSLHTAEAICLIGRSFKYMHQYNQAESLYKQALELIIPKLGNAHAVTATVKSNLAEVYVANGAYEEAILLHEEALSIRRTHPETEDTELAESLNNVASLYHTLGRLKEALPLYKEALTIRERAFGPEHYETALILNNIGDLYFSDSQYLQAEEYHKRSLQILRKSLRDGHPHIANSLNNLAETYSKQQKFSEAEPLFFEALSIYQSLPNIINPRLGGLLNKIGMLYLNQKIWDKAESFFNQALEVWKLTGEEHKNIGFVLNNLGQVLIHKKDYKNAENYIKKSIDILIKQIGFYHVDTSNCINTLAFLYKDQAQYFEAEKYFIQVLQIRERVLDESRIERIRSVLDLTDIMCWTSKFLEAEPLSRQALQLTEKYLGSNHELTKIAQQIRSFILKNIMKG